MKTLIAYLKPIALLASMFLLLSCQPEEESTRYVKVYKYDTSIQCGDNGVDLEVMALELINAGIDVICSQKGNDGLAYASVCGGGTGRINIYTIHNTNLLTAEALGFASVNELSDYQDQACE